MTTKFRYQIFLVSRHLLLNQNEQSEILKITQSISGREIRDTICFLKLVIKIQCNEIDKGFIFAIKPIDIVGNLSIFN